MRRRPVHARRVGLIRRLLASVVDCLLPTAGLYALIRTGAVSVGFIRPDDSVSATMFTSDRLLLILYEQPELYLWLGIMWMLLWTVVTMVTLGTVQTTVGKRLFGLSVRQRDGQKPDALRTLARVAAGWLVPMTLGLSYLWIWINPDGRGLHDVASGTWVVRVADQPIVPRTST